MRLIIYFSFSQRNQNVIDFLCILINKIIPNSNIKFDKKDWKEKFEKNHSRLITQPIFHIDMQDHFKCSPKKIEKNVFFTK